MGIAVRFECEPGALDIALAPRGTIAPPLASKARLVEIARHYEEAVGPMDFALRGGFFDTRGGAIVGLLRREGRQIQGATGQNWPCLAIDGGVARIITEREAADARLAAACGPLVLKGGALLGPVGFAGVQPFRRRPRTSVGVRADGSLVLAAYASATVREVGEDLLAMGAADALLYDGGHGTEVVDGSGVHTFGDKIGARIPWAWVVRGRLAG